MVINNESSVIHLKEKLTSLDRKKLQSENSREIASSGKSGSGGETEKQLITDIIGIRNENRLAASSGSSLQSEEEAFDMLEELKSQFAFDAESALKAHDKASPDSVMQFYPFE